jgi:hypothetical protein
MEVDALRDLPDAGAITVSFHVEGLPPLPNTTRGWHWTKVNKSKNEWTDKVSKLASQAKRKEKLKGLYEKVHIHYHISVGTNNKIDGDNVEWAVQKPANDGLVGTLIVDDNIDVITKSFSYDRKAKGFTITLTGK